MLTRAPNSLRIPATKYTHTPPTLPRPPPQIRKGERVRVLTEAEVEAHLTAIAEQD